MKTLGASLEHRAVVSLEGTGAAGLLSRVLTQKVEDMTSGSACYAALLTAQGRWFADFAVVRVADTVWYVECDAERAEPLATQLRRLAMRLEVVVQCLPAIVGCVWHESGETVARVSGADTNRLAYLDPRTPSMGARVLVLERDGIRLENELAAWDAQPCDLDAYHQHRIRQGIAEAGAWRAEKSLPLEYGLYALGGLSLDKGCFLGQELCARTIHRGQLHKHVLPLCAMDSGSFSSPEVLYDGQVCGEIVEAVGPFALARLKLDVARAVWADTATKPLLVAGQACTVIKPAWLHLNERGIGVPQKDR